MKVSTRVQHHPDRAALVGPLLARLPRGSVVVEDPNPDSTFRSPLRTYVQALAVPRAADVTHLLVVQDDAWPVDDFERKMLDAVEERPGDMIPFFVPGGGDHRRQMMKALARGERWARLSTGWVPTVALLWPVDYADAFVIFARGRWDFERRAGDDAPVGSFCTRHRIRVWAHVPSLVEHPDVHPSLIGKKHSAGKNRARVAAFLDGA